MTQVAFIPIPSRPSYGALQHSVMLPFYIKLKLVKAVLHFEYKTYTKLLPRSSKSNVCFSVLLAARSYLSRILNFYRETCIVLYSLHHDYDATESTYY